ncbi:MAG: carboxypeptidase regulatory-like domain-containing protein [Acidobacteria bacterium]|nr:carboxypeptidase regulatory-like domain-containing protein [Acidobacteriota bacterium]MBV9147912.1 carboxypeptidase regulatory-like domain-containing protein [Acidobacteriota bacterium]MBV9435970.1 carboxypeptidase regulatory-like domain-containing protein [Acidobacteriota bacterium]
MTLRRAAAVLVCLLFGVIGAFAQTTTVKGSVKDPSGPVAGAQVQLRDLDTGRKYTLKTDKKGNFFSIGITPGKFDVTVTKDGKQVFEDKFQAGMDEDKNVMDINLGPAGGAQGAAAAAGGQAASGQAASGQAPEGQTGGTMSAPGRQQQQPKLTEEQKKQLEEIQKKNAEIAKENAKIGSLNVLLKQALAQMQAKQYDAAVQTMEQAEQADGGQHALIFGQLGKAQVADKKYPEGIESLNKALQMSANDPKAQKTQLASYYDSLGEAYAKSNQTDQAIDAYNKEAEADPTNAAQAYYNEGAVLTNKGKADDANSAFTKSIQADPKKADAYYQRAINSLQKATVDKQGKMVAPQGTVDDFNKYLELEPEGPYAEASKQMLEQLGAKVQTGFKKK